MVTELEFSVPHEPTYYGGLIVYPGAHARRLLLAFSEWVRDLPESVSTSIALVPMPDMPEVPEPLRGNLSVHLRYVHIADADRGEQLLVPMRAVAEPLMDDVGLNPIATIVSVHRDPLDPMPAKEDSMLLADLRPETIDVLVEAAGPEAQIPLIAVEIRLMGGALALPAEQDSAVGGRHGAFHVFAVGPYPEPFRDAVDTSLVAAGPPSPRRD